MLKMKIKLNVKNIHENFEARLLLYVTETFPDLWNCGQSVFHVKSHDDVRFNIYSGIVHFPHRLTLQMNYYKCFCFVSFSTNRGTKSFLWYYSLPQMMSTEFI